MVQAGKRKGARQRPTGAGNGRAVRSPDEVLSAGGDSDAMAPTVGALAKLEPRRGPTKVQLNTRVLASTEARLNWLVKNRNVSVTSVVDVALQELFDRHHVPPADIEGRIVEQ